MIFRGFKRIFFYTILFILIFSTKGFCDYINLENNDIKYRIKQSQNYWINSNNTKAKINTVDQVITLKEINTLPDAIKFVGSKESGNLHDFVVLEQDGLRYHAFTGNDEQSYVKLPSLNASVNLPLGIAVNPSNQGSPSYLISHVLEDSGLRHFYYDNHDGMKDSALVTIAGLKYVTSLSTFTDTGDVGILTDEEFKFLNFSDELSSGVNFDFGVNKPLSIAAGSGFNFSILTEENIQHYKYDGSELSSIPILDIAISNNYDMPKSIVIDDKINTTFLLSDNKVTKFKLNENSMNYNVTLAISDLVDPISMALNTENGGMLVIDKESKDRFIAKYYMLNSSGRYVYNSSMSTILGEMVTSSMVKRYVKEGVVELGTFKAGYEEADLIRLRAYTETPKGTKLIFQVANTLDVSGEPMWIDAWSISNDNNDDVNSGELYKYNQKSVIGGNNLYFGTNIHGYPTFQNFGYDYSDNDDFIIIDDNDVPIVEGNTNYNDSLWMKLPEKGDLINVRVLLSTNNINHSPKIFAPIGTNNISGIKESDDVAIHVEINKEPNKPDIIEVKNPWDVVPQEPSDDEFAYDPRDGWIYSTTPVLQWSLDNVDGEIANEAVAFQVIMMGYTKDGWAIAYNSGFSEGLGCEFTVPTNYDNDKNGYMWDIDAYVYGLVVRVMNAKGGISEFSDVSTFKVLAYERPRIANLVYPSETFEGTENLVPVFNKNETHKVIVLDDTVEDLIVSKAGSQVTLMIDSVGPIASEPLENAMFYVLIDEEEVPLRKTDCYAVNPLGMESYRNRWIYNFFTDAPITKIPDDTVIYVRIAGVCDEFEDGGTTIFYIPDYAEGLIKTRDTTYSDWQTIIKGRDR